VVSHGLLPEGYSVRAPTANDAEAELIAACQLAVGDRSGMTIEELLGDWRKIDLSDEVAVVALDGRLRRRSQPLLRLGLRLRAPRASSARSRCLSGGCAASVAGRGVALLRHAFGEFYRRGVRKVGLSVDAASATVAPRLYGGAGMQVEESYVLYQKELRPGRHAHAI